MTTIAVNKDSIACDLQFTHSSGLKFKGATKVVDVPTQVASDLFGTKRALIGFCGSADVWGEVVGWLHLPDGKPPRCTHIEMLMLTGERKIFHGINLKNWLEIKEPVFAIGSGMQYAMGALRAGKTPKEAIKIASQYDAGTGLGCKVYEL